MNRIATILAALAVIIAGGLWYFMQGEEAPPPPVPTAQQQGAEASPPAEEALPVIEDITMGNPEASVTVIEYASFTCPHCKNFHAGPLKQLKAEYIDTGKINFVYREVYFDKFGLWAALLARCGGKERYMQIADMLYERQSQWLAGGDVAQVVTNLHQIGRDAGLSDDKVAACLTDTRMARALVATYQKNAEADGIDSTPSFVINGQKYNNMPYSEFRAVLEEQLTE